MLTNSKWVLLDVNPFTRLFAEEPEFLPDQDDGRGRHGSRVRRHHRPHLLHSHRPHAVICRDRRVGPLQDVRRQRGQHLPGQPVGVAGVKEAPQALADGPGHGVALGEDEAQPFGKAKSHQSEAFSC